LTGEDPTEVVPSVLSPNEVPGSVVAVGSLTVCAKATPERTRAESKALRMYGAARLIVLTFLIGGGASGKGAALRARLPLCG
jgi:hypothetical protein